MSNLYFRNANMDTKQILQCVYLLAVQREG
jgi:hypothetical protein